MKKLIYLLYILTTNLILISCVQNRPTRNCPIKDLLLDESDFPVGTIFGEILSPLPDFPLESAGQTVGYHQNLIDHVVARYSSKKQAERMFLMINDISFEEDDYRGPWVTPNEITFFNPIAQQYKIACGNIGSEYQCRMIAQYEEYYVWFFAYLSEGGVNYVIFQDLLDKIDYHMAQCLQINY